MSEMNLTNDKSLNGKQIPCEIIRDLLPSYVDELTSEITNEKINEHISECAVCKEKLESMRIPYEANAVEAGPLSDQELETIDFMKKTKRKGMANVIKGVIAATVIVAFIAVVVVFSIRYVIGFEMKMNHDSWDIVVNGNSFELTCVPEDDDIRFNSYSFAAEQGIIRISYKVVYNSFMNAGDKFNFHYETETAGEEGAFKEIWVGDDLIWANGHYISSTALDTFYASHSYIGDAPANAITANALKISRRYGSFSNELETSGERMIWRIIFDPKDGGHRFNANQLDGIGYAMIATIDNLDEVEFEWSSAIGDNLDADHFYTHKVVKEGKLNYTDKNVKEVGANPASLAELLENYGIYN